MQKDLEIHGKGFIRKTINRKKKHNSEQEFKGKGCLGRNNEKKS